MGAYKTGCFIYQDDTGNKLQDVVRNTFRMKSNNI
jgi:hypothetical protein